MQSVTSGVSISRCCDIDAELGWPLASSGQDTAESLLLLVSSVWEKGGTQTDTDTDPQLRDSGHITTTILVPASASAVVTTILIPDP